MSEAVLPVNPVSGMLSSILHNDAQAVLDAFVCCACEYYDSQTLSL